MPEETYKQDDLILGCKIKVRVTDEYVFLYIGGRDHQWRRSDGSHVGSGAALCSPIPRVPLGPNAQQNPNPQYIQEKPQP